MLKIGITGGMGSGKTTVCHFFELQGIPVFYADVKAKEIMQHDEQLISELRIAFGNDVYSLDGILQRRKLAEIVFSDRQKLNLLNSYVHPAVFRAFDRWLEQQTAPYVVKEAALLFESGSYKSFDYNILVTSPQTLKISRIMQRDSLSEQEIIARMDKQLPDEEKEKLADFIIRNDEQELIMPQLLALHQRFLKERDKRR